MTRTTTPQTTMQAAITTQWHQMQLQELTLPQPGVGQVRIRICLAGICGSDVHIFLGHHPTAVSPVVQGHELVGIVDAMGSMVDSSIEIGHRVVVDPLISCGSCEACRRGHLHVCRSLKLLGIHENGAFAEYCLAPANKVIAVPQGLSDQWAVLTEPFAVGVHVCQRAALEPGVRALVCGAGPIGLIVAMVAKLAGAEVVISEISESRLKLAESFGFKTLDAGNNPQEQVAAITDQDGFDVVFEVTGSPKALALAIDAARVRGKIVQVGFYSNPPNADLMKLTLKELTLVGSRVYTNEDFRRAVRLLSRVAENKLLDLDKLICEQTNLAGIEPAMQRMIAGDVVGKIVVDLR